MAFTHLFKPSHKDVKRYYEELASYATHQVSHETAVRTAFSNLLASTCSKAGWHLVPEQTTRVKGKQVRSDGTLRDDIYLRRGLFGKIRLHAAITGTGHPYRLRYNREATRCR